MRRALSSHTRYETEASPIRKVSLPSAAVTGEKSHDLWCLYLVELQEARCMEEQVAAALSEMAETLGDAHAKAGMRSCANAAQAHTERLDVLLRRHHLQSARSRDETMQNIIAAARKWPVLASHPGVRDAGRIASLQRIAHYRVAACEVLGFWARELRLWQDADLLHLILKEARRCLNASTRMSAEIGSQATPNLGRSGIAASTLAPALRPGPTCLSAQADRRGDGSGTLE